MKTDDLILLSKALFTRVKEKRGYVTKTKFFKYLYLIDIEVFRKQRSTLSGFPWIFYRYGPWCQECEDFYQKLKELSIIQTNAGGTDTDVDIEFINTTEDADLDEVMDRLDLPLEIRRIVDLWADKRLGEMLNYVYFSTDPMQTAIRGEVLDFSGVSATTPTGSIVLQKSGASAEEIEKVRAIVNAKKRELTSSEQKHFTPPNYDPTYFEALRVMNDEDDEDLGE